MVVVTYEECDAISWWGSSRDGKRGVERKEFGRVSLETVWTAFLAGVGEEGNFGVFLRTNGEISRGNDPRAPEQTVTRVVGGAHWNASGVVAARR